MACYHSLYSTAVQLEAGYFNVYIIEYICTAEVWFPLMCTQYRGTAVGRLSLFVQYSCTVEGRLLYSVQNSCTAGCMLHKHEKLQLNS